MQSRFNRETTDAILRALSAGSSLADAAEQAGMPAQTVRNWLVQGRAEMGSDTPHARFAAAVDAAREAAREAELTEPEFRERLDSAVRGGSIQALRLWWQIHAGDRGDDRPPDRIDALKAQREARLARLRGGSVNGNGNGTGGVA